MSNENTTATSPEDLEKAKQIIEAEGKARAKKCWDEVQAVFKSHGCTYAHGLNIGGQSVPAHQVLNCEIILHIIPQ